MWDYTSKANILATYLYEQLFDSPKSFKTPNLYREAGSDHDRNQKRGEELAPGIEKACSTNDFTATAPMWKWEANKYGKSSLNLR